SRISTTSSVGTRISPNLSCRPCSLIRSFRASATRCSKFEYACTTYQRSAISTPLTCEPLRELGQDSVDQPEKQTQQRDHEENHGRGLPGFFAARPNDLAQLDARGL